MIECEWHAWYDRLPGSANPPLHVAASCEIDGSETDLRLERDYGADEPGVLALRLVAEKLPTGDGTPAEKQVSWTGVCDEQITRVRIRGEAEELIDVKGRP